MPARPASPQPRLVARPATRTLAGRIRRFLFKVLLVALLAPPALLLAYRFLPPPVTPLMLIRLAEGEGLEKHWRPLEEIAPALAEAVVAAEDNRFCAHWGVDWPALQGEVEAWLAGEPARGASTITMQTAKNLFLWPDRSLVRKALEAPLTPQLELLWPKRRIVEVYLNVVEFGPGIYGAEAAAQSYFGKPAAGLSQREAALLAAVLPHPRSSSPARPSAYLEDRARTIRGRIDQLGPMLGCLRDG
ncbi:MAG TPA: monofunctional biosynthetic peptidoglycan transglycosylase, partial [Geminicoccaceae bacterium]|nr:monofunctional biosynthetic peptidoglycan transglycosylase [Geminicoccaceae bacterium]